MSEKYMYVIVVVVRAVVVRVVVVRAVMAKISSIGWFYLKKSE